MESPTKLETAQASGAEQQGEKTPEQERRGDALPLSTHYQERWEYYRRVAQGHLYTLKGPIKRIGVNDLVELRCPYNHLVLMRARHLLRGTQCTACINDALAAFKLRQLEDARELAESRGGKCEAAGYESAKVPIEWQCSKGHVWMASLDNVRSKESWCPRCARAAPRKRRKVGTPA